MKGKILTLLFQRKKKYERKNEEKIAFFSTFLSFFSKKKSTLCYFVSIHIYIYIHYYIYTYKYIKRMKKTFDILPKEKRVHHNTIIVVLFFNFLTKKSLENFSKPFFSKKKTHTHTFSSHINNNHKERALLSLFKIYILYIFSLLIFFFTHFLPLFLQFSSFFKEKTGIILTQKALFASTNFFWTKKRIKGKTS